MTRIRVLLLTIAILFSFSFVSNFGPGMKENSFIIDGDGFKNQYVRLNIKTNDFYTNFYGRGIYNFYEDNENMDVKASGWSQVLTNTPIAGINIAFNKFNGIGKYTLDSATSVSIFFKKNDPNAEYDYHYLLDNDGEIIINSYGQVGELIEGTFSGKFIKLIYNKTTGYYTETDTEVVVKDGKFSVVRFPDYHWDAPISTGKEPEEFKKDKKKK